MPYPTVAHQEITLQVQEDYQHAIDSWELTEFLYLLRAAYARALQLDLHDPEDVVRDELYLSQQFAKPFVGPTIAEEEVSQLFQTDLGQDELRFRRISYASPIEITCICLASALTLAVILSGGKASFPRLSVLASSPRNRHQEPSERARIAHAHSSPTSEMNQRPNQTMQPTAGRHTASLFDN